MKRQNLLLENLKMRYLSFLIYKLLNINFTNCFFTGTTVLYMHINVSTLIKDKLSLSNKIGCTVLYMYTGSTQFL